MMSKRRAGILCHITSLPNDSFSGDINYGNFGANAYKFVDFLSSCGFSVWQILPIGPTHSDNSPYLSLSAHAGNTKLIDLDWLTKKGLLRGLDPIEERKNYSHFHETCLKVAYEKFLHEKDSSIAQDFHHFKKKHSYWLKDFSLFMALRHEFKFQSWINWPDKYRCYNNNNVESLFSKEFKHKIAEIEFQQFIFFAQWKELKDYASNKGIYIMGDMPIFVSHDSADVWSNKEYFTLDDYGEPKFVAGVPPDYFSETGQRWGNPHYQWEKLENDDFKWWVDRLQTQSELFDALRIDHFPGLYRYWEIPSSETTAINGRWVNVPGDKLLSLLTNVFPNLELIAEDLGTIIPEITHLRDKFSLPGMLVMQFAFDGNEDNPYLPKHHIKNSVVYTATHDNDTTLGWYMSLPDEIRNYVDTCLGYPSEAMPWPIIHSALASPANLAIIPMQDILGLDSKSRMNTPSTTKNNWKWQFSWHQVENPLLEKYKSLLEIYDRNCC